MYEAVDYRAEALFEVLLAHGLGEVAYQGEELENFQRGNPIVSLHFVVLEEPGLLEQLAREDVVQRRLEIVQQLQVIFQRGGDEGLHIFDSVGAVIKQLHRAVCVKIVCRDGLSLCTY